jgi:hypothetical protein
LLRLTATKRSSIRAFSEHGIGLYPGSSRSCLAWAGPEAVATLEVWNRAEAGAISCFFAILELTGIELLVDASPKRRRDTGWREEER